MSIFLDMSVAEYSDMLASEPSRQKYQEELCQLRTEFTTYKQRAQSVLKSKTSKVSTVHPIYSTGLLDVSMVFSNLSVSHIFS